MQIKFDWSVSQNKRKPSLVWMLPLTVLNFAIPLLWTSEMKSVHCQHVSAMSQPSEHKCAPVRRQAPSSNLFPPLQCILQLQHVPKKKWFAYTISLVPWASMWEVQEDVLSFNSWLQKSLKWLAASILYLLFWYILMLWNDMKSSGQKSPKSGTSKAAFSYTNCTVIITFSDYRIPLRIFSEMGAGSSSTPKRPTAKEPPRTCQITGKSNVGSSAKSDCEEAWVLEPPLPLRPFWFEKPQ